MKRTFFALVMVLCTITFTLSSCKKKEQTPDSISKIVASVKTDKAKVPYEVNENTTLIDCYLQENTVTYKYEVKPEVFKAMDADKQKENTLNSLKTNLNSQDMCKDLKAANCSLRYIYTDSKDSIVFTVTPKELN